MAKFISRYRSHIVAMDPGTGKKIRFVEGKYETSNEAEVDFLRKHREFGVSIFEETEEERPRRGRKSEE